MRQHIENRVKIGFLIDGVQQTLLMSLRDAKRMDAVLLGERVRFRLKTASGVPFGFYFQPEDFFVWKRSGFEALFHTLQSLASSYSCSKGGRGFVGLGSREAFEKNVLQGIQQAA